MSFLDFYTASLFYFLEYKQCGRVYLAGSDESVYNARRIYSRSLIHTDKTELLDCPSEMLARWPVLATEDIRVSWWEVFCEGIGISILLVSKV